MEEALAVVVEVEVEEVRGSYQTSFEYGTFYFILPKLLITGTEY